MNETTDERLDLTSHQSRAALTKMVLTLFEHWNLDSVDQLKLLGYKPTCKSSLARLQGGAPIPASKDKLTRISMLFSIHKSLRILFPHDRALCYRWVKLPNKAFSGRSALEIMVESVEGLQKVCQYLWWHLER